MKLNKEVLEELKKCKSEKEFLEVTKKNCIELSEEDLNAVNGGGFLDVVKKIVTTIRNENAIYGSNLDSLNEEDDNLGNPS